MAGGWIPTWPSNVDHSAPPPSAPSPRPPAGAGRAPHRRQPLTSVPAPVFNPRGQTTSHHRNTAASVQDMVLCSCPPLPGTGKPHGKPTWPHRRRDSQDAFVLSCSCTATRFDLPGIGQNSALSSSVFVQLLETLDIVRLRVSIAGRGQQADCGADGE